MWNITQKVTQFAYHPKCHKTRQDSITYFISLLLIRCLRQFCLWVGKEWCHGPVRYPLIRLKKRLKHVGVRFLAVCQCMLLFLLNVCFMPLKIVLVIKHEYSILSKKIYAL